MLRFWDRFQAMFDEIASLAHDADRMFQQAAKQLVEAGQLQRLFDLRLMQRRHELGLPLDQATTLDDVEESARQPLEDAYLEACREVGLLLLETGQAREAWMYLRPAGEKAAMRRWLERAVPDEELADELIELALHEGIDPERGFAWLLGRRGTCNAITELEAMCGQLPIQDQRACTAVLVRHMHEELLSNIRGHLQRLEQSVPDGNSISRLLADHPALLEEGAYHIDTSHLATTVRLARLLSDPSLLQMAIELADYGSKLNKDLQYPDQPPFEDLYPTHLLLFRATLGEEVDQALDYFAKRARTVAVEEHGATALETYLILLERTGRTELAMDEYAELTPADSSLSPYAPSLLHLAQVSGRWDRYLEICQNRNDVVGFAAGQVSKQHQDH